MLLVFILKKARYAPSSLMVLTRILSSQLLFFNSKKEYPENAARYKNA
jgi:hypothetical protein